MRIGINARLLERKITGIGRYLAGVLRYIREFDKENDYILFSLGRLEHYQRQGFKVVSAGSDNLISSKVYSPVWLNFVLPGLLKKHEIDVFFSPDHFLPLKKYKWKNLFVVHDLFHKIDKSYHPFCYRKYSDFFLSRSIKKSDTIITVSENSKKDIIEFYDVPAEKIHVIYEAADPIFEPRSLDVEQRNRLISKYNLPERFILYVGVIENRKNIVGILKTADLLESKGKDIKIVLVGKQGFGFMDIFKHIKKRENVWYLNYVEDEDLSLLYNLASVFFFPSFYEGFGIPPLEAMQSGVPTLTSNTSSLPEVVGEGGIMHTPIDYEAFALDIIRLLEDNRFCQSRREKGILQARKFDQRAQVGKLVEIFNKYR